MAATVALGNGTLTSLAELTAPGTVGGSGTVTFPGGITVVGALAGATTVNSLPVKVGQGSPGAVPGFYVGVGAPTFSAANGSIYVRYDGTTGGTLLYVNTSGASTSGTTWTDFN